MSVSQHDVMLALLAFDAYSRHADEDKRKIGNEDGSQLAPSIGNATFVRSSDRLEDAHDVRLDGSKLAGFSASEYDLNGQKVVSNRGTDFDFSSWEGFKNFLQDFGAGWAQSFGVLSPDEFGVVPGEPLVKFQPYYAVKFFEIVTGAKIILSDEEKKALIEAGQLVVRLEGQYEIAIQEKADLLPQLETARQERDTIKTVYDDAVAAANAGIVGEVDTLEEAELQTTRDSARPQLDAKQAVVIELEARLAEADAKIADTEHQLSSARQDLAAKQPKESPIDVHLTGHSLGGALAGYVAAFDGEKATTFNEIAFLAMSFYAKLSTFIESNLHNGVGALTTAMQQLLDGQPINVEGYYFTQFEIPDLSALKSFRMEGEVAEYARDTASLISTIAPILAELLGGRVLKLLTKTDALSFLGGQIYSTQKA